MLGSDLKHKAKLPSSEIPSPLNFLSLSSYGANAMKKANESTPPLKEKRSSPFIIPCCHFLNLRASLHVHYCSVFLQDVMVRGRSPRNRTH